MFREAVEIIATITKIEHQLPVLVVPAPCIDFAGKVAFGVFVSKPLGICVAGELPDELFDEEERFFISTLVHEIAHYEQFRDGKKLQERGVPRRTNTLTNKIRPKIRYNMA